MSEAQGHGPVTFEAALEVIEALAKAHMRSTGRALRSVVAFGGTAMAAMAVRTRSEDVDLYMTDVGDDVLDLVTRNFRSRFGPTFKIDATPSKQLFGAIVVEDLDSSPIVARIVCDGNEIAVKALSVETMYVIKVAADRPKDQLDISALSKRSSFEKILKRAKELFPWYADRAAFPEYVERLARYMARDFRKALADVDDSLDLSATVWAKVQAIRKALDARFLQTLKILMRERPELLTFDPQRPEIVAFDAKAAGASDEIVALTYRDAGSIADMAASALKTHDPDRHIARLHAIKKARQMSS